MSKDNPSDDRPHVIQPFAADEIRVNADESQVELWMAGNYAAEWFKNAKQQSLFDDDLDEMAKPREIVFAVCAIESYLVEWVRDEILNSNYQRLRHYFPIEQKRFLGITARWQQIVNRLAIDRAIPAKPEFGEAPYWKQFEKLVLFRNGLVHGRASRPDSNMMRDHRERPGPTIGDLVKMYQGWPVSVVAEVIRKLHAAAGTNSPEWLDA
jgi:hypothetical protein